LERKTKTEDGGNERKRGRSVFTEPKRVAIPKTWLKASSQGTKKSEKEES